MSNGETAVIVLAAGLGTRMKSARPKVLHGLGGRPIIGHVMEAVNRLEPRRLVVVVGPGMEEVAAAVAPAATAVQRQRLGTGDAVKTARPQLAGFDGTVLIVFGDTPLIRPERLAALAASRAAGISVAVLGFRAARPGDYGRLIVDGDGRLERIVEARDAGPVEAAVDLCNSGVMAVDGAVLFDLVDRIGTDNAKGEYYLTDIVGLARADGLACAVIEGDEQELVGINSRADLAAAESLLQAQWRARAMEDGVTLVDPGAVWLSYDTELAADVVVHPNVVFGPGVRVEAGAEIRSFSHLEGVAVGPGATVGPFARIRPETTVGAGARIGNFVEAKNAVLAEGVRAMHLSYLGDVAIGPASNIGAGTVFCNFDGVHKHRTEIGADVFIGSNSVLVAPVSVGDHAFVAAASAITHDVAAGDLAIGRARQTNKAGRGRRLKARLKASAGAAPATAKASD